MNPPGPRVELALHAKFDLPRPPATAGEVLDAAGALMVKTFGEARFGPDSGVFGFVLRPLAGGTAAADVWELRGLPRGRFPDDGLVRAMVWGREPPGSAVVLARFYVGLDPAGQEAVGIQFFLEHQGNRTWAVLRFVEKGAPPPATEAALFPRRLLGPPRPGTAWIGVPPEPGRASLFDQPN